MWLSSYNYTVENTMTSLKMITSPSCWQYILKASYRTNMPSFTKLKHTKQSSFQTVQLSSLLATHLLWDGCCLLSQTSGLFVSLVCQEGSKAPPGTEAVSRLGVKRWNRKRERKEERTSSVFHFYPYYCQLPPPPSASPPPKRDGPVSPWRGNQTCP